MNCRHCKTKLDQVFIDLGSMPPSNAYLTKDDLNKKETSYPLRVLVCTNCWLVQTEDFAQPDELFSADYAYFSSTSISWLRHAKEYCNYVINEFNLSSDSFVVEIASNDGYLLKNFVDAGVPCLGVEPTACTADAAEKLNIPVIREFFGEELAKKMVRKGDKADLIIGNNVFAHVPDIKDFAIGMSLLLKSDGIINLEFPHLLSLVELCQFDTIYHEHFSYLSLTAVNAVFNSAGLRVFDVEKLDTHGGSLRVYGCKQDAPYKSSQQYKAIIENEFSEGYTTVSKFESFQDRVNCIRDECKKFLSEQKGLDKISVGYGAAAKGNTLLNYAGVDQDLISFICDAAKSKQGKYMPGSHIPILHPDKIKDVRPDYIIILPWNLREEIMAELMYVREWGCKFVTFIPRLCVF